MRVTHDPEVLAAVLAVGVKSRSVRRYRLVMILGDHDHDLHCAGYTDDVESGLRRAHNVEAFLVDSHDETVLNASGRPIVLPPVSAFEVVAELDAEVFEDGAVVLSPADQFTAARDRYNDAASDRRTALNLRLDAGEVLAAAQKVFDEAVIDADLYDHEVEEARRAFVAACHVRDGFR